MKPAVISFFLLFTAGAAHAAGLFPYRNQMIEGDPAAVVSSHYVWPNESHNDIQVPRISRIDQGR